MRQRLGQPLVSNIKDRLTLNVSYQAGRARSRGRSRGMSRGRGKFHYQFIAMLLKKGS